MIGSNLRFGKSISSPFIDPSPAKDRLSLLITYVKSNFNSHVVTIKKESVDAQIYKFVLRGKHLRARLISSPHLRYIFLRRGGWTDRSMVQSRLSGHGGRVLAAPRRLRLAFPDSVRRRPDAATVGRSARSGHQSASSEPANLSLSLSLALSRARRGARARAAASSRHTRTSTHRNTCRAHACPPESAHMHTAFPLAPSHPAERPSSSRGDPARRGLHPAHDARGSPSSWLVPRGCSAFPNIHEASSRCPHVRTHARTQHHRPRSRTTRILPPLFSTDATLDTLQGHAASNLRRGPLRSPLPPRSPSLLRDSEQHIIRDTPLGPRVSRIRAPDLARGEEERNEEPRVSRACHRCNCLCLCSVSRGFVPRGSCVRR